jgi:hypothetical protein
VPLTYLSHQAAVVPLKMWRPAWFDGAALVFGSMAPDWAYVLNGSRFAVNAHVWPGALWFALPAAVLVTLVVRASEADALAALPWRPALVTDLLSRRPVRRPFAIVVGCAALGIVTHIVWDAFTHDFRWGAQHIGWLRDRTTIGGHSLTHAHLLQQISTVGGAIVTLALLIVIGRQHRVLEWRPSARPVPRLRRDPWVLGSTVTGVVLGAWWAAGVDHDVAAAVNRLVLTTGFFFLVAARVFAPRPVSQDVEVPT